MNDEHSKGLPYNRRQPLDFFSRSPVGRLPCLHEPASDGKQSSSGNAAIYPASDRSACMSRHLLDNGQRRALPGAARSIAMDRERLIPIRLTGERLYGRILEIQPYLF